MWWQPPASHLASPTSPWMPTHFSDAPRRSTRSWPRRDPGDAKLLQELATVEDVLGGNYQVLGEHAKALPHHERARELAEQQLALEPGNSNALSQLAAALGNIGAVLMRGTPKAPDRAVPLLERALRIRRDARRCRPAEPPCTTKRRLDARAARVRPHLARQPLCRGKVPVGSGRARHTLSESHRCRLLLAIRERLACAGRPPCGTR